MPDPTPEHIDINTELCACCGEQKPDLTEYTGVTGGPICESCFIEWSEGQRENVEW